MMGGVIVGISYMQRNKFEANSPRPAYVTKIEQDIEAETQDGKTVRLSSMKEKVYLTFLCSAEAEGTSDPLPGAVLKVAKEFAGRPDFGIVIFSATPEKDTPEQRRAFLARHGLADQGWLFLSTEPEKLNRYLRRFLRLYSVMPDIAGVKSTNVRHDTRVVLVDRKANIRGYYRLLDPEHGPEYAAALRQHLAYVLDNP
jgi:cytochrome oxidase Cu insertion factor (SCO1/SenC/PrrC family)